MLPTVEIKPVSVDLRLVPKEHRTRFMNPGELEILAGLLAPVAPRRMAEFGCQNGRTARVLMAGLPSLERYIGIDVPAGYVTACKVQRGEVPARPGELAYADSRFVCLVAGRGSHALTAEDLGPIDAAFIDGDHSVAGVLNDYRLCKATIRPGGIIIFHDYHELGTVGVADALHELAGAGAPIVHVAKSWVCFEQC